MFTGKESLVTPCSALVHNYGCGASSPTTIALTSPFQKFSQQYEPTFFLFTSSLSEFLVESSMYGPKNSRRSVTSFTFHSSSESNGRAFCVCVCASSLLTPCKTSGDSVLVTLDHCSAPKINTLTLGSVTLSPPPLPPLLQTDR